MPGTTPEQISQHRVIDDTGLQDIIIRSHSFRWSKDTALAGFEGVEEVSLLGPANAAESIPEGQLGWQHGFVVRALRLTPGASIPAHVRREEEVLFIQQGSCLVTVDRESLKMGPGDTFTTPIGSTRAFANQGQKACTIYVTRRNNQPLAPEFT